MRPSLVILLFASLSSRAEAQRCTSRGTAHPREDMAHRTPTATAGTPVRVEAMAAWPAPSGMSDPRTRARDAPIDPRELQAFTVEGALWRLLIAQDRCTMELELSARGAGPEAPRVIAVIPAGAAYEAAWGEVLRSFPSAGELAPGRPLRFDSPIPLRLTGFAFYDAARWCRADAVRGCGHGSAAVATLWELRPVWRTETLPPAPLSILPVAPPSPTPLPPLSPAPSQTRVVCCDGSTSACPCQHDARVACCEGHRGACGCGGPPVLPPGRPPSQPTPLERDAL